MNNKRRYPIHPDAGSISKISSERLYEIYGHNSTPQSYFVRFEEEIDKIMKNKNETVYYAAMRIAREAKKHGYSVQSRGCIGSSFVAYLLGITGINPLPPHYLCAKCKKKSEYVPGVASGYDLPDKDCPDCGGIMKGDGHDIPFESFAGLEGEKIPDIDLNIANEYWSHAQEVLKSLFHDDLIVNAGARDKNGAFFAHPGGWFIIPKEYADDVPIIDITRGDGSSFSVTYQEFHELNKTYLKLDILSHNTPKILTQLSTETGIQLDDIPMNDSKVMAMITSGDTDDIPEFRTEFAKEIIDICKPTCFSDLVKISGFLHGTDVWTDNAEKLIKTGQASLQDTLSVREDVFRYLLDGGAEWSEAYRIMELARKGLVLWEFHESDFEHYDRPDWFDDSICKIGYMFPKAHVVSYVKSTVQTAWFKVYHRKLFDKVVAELKQ